MRNVEQRSNLNLLQCQQTGKEKKDSKNNVYPLLANVLPLVWFYPSNIPDFIEVHPRVKEL